MQNNICMVCGGRNTDGFCTARDRHGSGTWRIERCRDCGFGWTSPAIAEEQIASYYPTVYLGDTRKTLDDFFSGRLAHSRSWRGELAKTRLVERYIDRGRILDVGCGDGKFLWALDPQRWERTGVEASRDTVTIVTQRIPSLHLVAGDIYAPTLAEVSYDAITFWHVLEHLPDPRKVLKQVFELLRPGGWLFISLPNLESLQAHLFRAYWYPFGDVPRHIYHFSAKALDLLIGEPGLKVRAHRLFSPDVNFHSLKHSTLAWSVGRLGSRIPYYVLKPLLFLFPLLERCTANYGILTAIAQKPE